MSDRKKGRKEGMALDLAERFRQRLGDPKEAFEQQRRLERDLHFLLSNLDKWRETHPNRWIAVYNGKLVAVADTRDRLLKELEAAGVPLRHALIDFVGEQKVALVL